MGATPNTGTKLKAPPRSSLPDGAFPASPFGWLYVFQPVGTSSRSGGVFSCVRKSLVFRIPHVGKPHRPKVGFGSRADSTVTVSIRPLLGPKRT